MKKNIILSFILCVAFGMGMYSQDSTSEKAEVDTSEVEEDIERTVSPKKGDFTAEILFGNGAYDRNSLSVPNSFGGSTSSTVSGYSPTANISANDNSVVNMIGAEVRYYFSDRWAAYLSGGTILSTSPNQLSVPQVSDPATNVVIIPGYSVVVSDERIDANMSIGAQYSFKTGSKKLFPYARIGVPMGYARRSLYNPTIRVTDDNGGSYEVSHGPYGDLDVNYYEDASNYGENHGDLSGIASAGEVVITDLGVRHATIKSYGVEAVVGVDYYLTEEVYLGFRITPYTFNYVYSTQVPGPGLPPLKIDSYNTGIFVKPTISVGFNFGSKDRDGDGIADKNDACPDEFGIEALNGCPEEDEIADTDGDGVTDDVDRCPYTAGPSETWGCPDYDGDGVLDLDEDDLCPGIAGPSENNGCPWPDTDGDGVLDKDDKCIDVAGPADNDGCPLIDAGAKELIDAYAKDILFKTGSAEFQGTVSTKLDEIAVIMNDYPKATFLIEGHTDSVGGENLNQNLSEARANAVLNYLVNNGKVMSSRLTSRGVGETQPEFDNNTVEGRSFNRRVLVITTSN